MEYFIFRAKMLTPRMILFNWAFLVVGWSLIGMTRQLHAVQYRLNEISRRTVNEGADMILKRAFSPFFVKLQRNFEEGFLELMKYDHMTTRQYLREEM
jgi:hypothetical protein